MTPGPKSAPITSSPRAGFCVLLRTSKTLGQWSKQKGADGTGIVGWIDALVCQPKIEVESDGAEELKAKAACTSRPLQICHSFTQSKHMRNYYIIINIIWNKHFKRNHRPRDDSAQLCFG